MFLPVSPNLPTIGVTGTLPRKGRQSPGLQGACLSWGCHCRESQVSVVPDTDPPGTSQRGGCGLHPSLCCLPSLESQPESW